MNYWFECKVSYERQADSMGMKKVSESYLVDALSFTEAEERIIKEVSPFVSVGELEVVNIRRARIAELFAPQRCHRAQGSARWSDGHLRNSCDHGYADLGCLSL